MSARTRRISAVSFTLLAASLLLAPGLGAQQSPTWLPFVGCWEPVSAEEDPGLLCFRLAGGGVELTNVFEGEVTASERLVADGVARPVEAEGCTGTESVDFSEDGRRIFTASSFVCEGGDARTGTGVMSFIAPGQWIDVRSLTVGGEPVAWVQRYSAATSESLSDHGVEDPTSVDRAGIRSTRILAARDIEIADVEEAVRRIDPEAAKIWVATHETRFDLNGSELVRLADAGVPEDVIDVMVAVSFPDHFVLTPEGLPEEVRDRVVERAYYSGARIGFRAFMWDPFYAPFGYGYGYAPFGYYGYGGYYGYVPATVIVVPRGPSYKEPAGGRMVNDQGYRRPSSSSGGSSGGSSDPAPSSGSDGGGSSDSGRSSSGSSGSGRTAVPR